MMRIQQLLLILFVGTMVIGCAQELPISGGKKDTDPPEILKSVPINGSRNFRGKKIIMEFDEFVQLKNQTAELLVSPPLKYAPEFKMAGKRVIVKVSDTLLPNTTYLFNFGKGIVDFREGNPLDSNIIVFSTGEKLDTFSIKGVLKNSKDLLPVKDANVMLYEDLSDSVSSYERPTYLARTNEQGEFTLPYVSNKNYQIFALKDNNRNYLFDISSEEIAFLKNPVNPSSDIVKLYLFQEETTQQYVRNKSQIHYGALSLGLNASFKKLAIESVNLPKDFKVERIVETDSVVVWFPTPPEGDSLYFYVSDESDWRDTVNLRWKNKEKWEGKRKRKKKKVEFEVKADLPEGTLDYFDTLWLDFSQPLSKWNPHNVLFTRGRDTISVDSIAMFNKLRLFKKLKRRVPFIFPWKQGEQYKIKLLPSSATDLFGTNIDSTSLSIRTLKFEDYGSMVFKLQAPNRKHNYVLELLDSKQNVVKSWRVKPSDKVEWKRIRPGKYQFKLIYDVNENGSWDTGKYGEKRQPEKIVFYNKPINVRANWDVDLEWKVVEE